MSDYGHMYVVNERRKGSREGGVFSDGINCFPSNKDVSLILRKQFSRESYPVLVESSMALLQNVRLQQSTYPLKSFMQLRPTFIGYVAKINFEL